MKLFSMAVGKRAKLQWKDENFPSLPDIPIGWTYREVIIEMYTRANSKYDHAKIYLCDVG